MSNDQGERHPFLDDLTGDAELISSVLRDPLLDAMRSGSQLMP